MNASGSDNPGDEGARILALYGARLRRRALLVGGLGALAVLGLLLDMMTGPAGLTAAQIWAALTWGDAERAVQVIVWQVRLPVALMAVCVGAALSLAGAEMQTILDNPLASPFTLGVSAAASFGAALAIILGLGLSFAPAGVAVSVNAFLFAFGSVLLLQALARRAGGGQEALVLCGIALVFTFNALLALVQFLGTADALQQFVFWSMGSLARADMRAVVAMGAVIAVTLPFSLAASWRMTALRLGSERAASFGINVGRLRFLSLLRASLLASTAVAFVGVIGFVGLVGPHIARMLIGEDHRFFLPASALTGAVVMSFASIVSKMATPGVVLPVGLVTSLIGLPVFLALILRRRQT
ncbi:FecCD family ABC transporter permease [Camelimonas lactis]|uniref:Iron complex transport system permease protein n=1 Tax=Camelimonas lactis TaxID=659006 RepID=A0A4R2GT42_9HYPH|nr:iron ABC transporter permease [Camelimonas lactis]TCO12768.1 iron complex transport system permease protein [Camelimonas lactis]